MLCDDIRRMLSELDGLETIINNQSSSQTDRSEAVQKAKDLAAKIRTHRETHVGCDYRPVKD
jgi:hypothetical protein